jgi:hypothetical protein
MTDQDFTKEISIMGGAIFLVLMRILVVALVLYGVFWGLGVSK